ncbi:unnamed protein product [Rotaria socialis]|uniref:Methyltransferase FkbM domain-containing protein n=1 Tax=Rotaria socialis TaxID=392032 RepID=A0A817URJ9_9BILA|nr:unnamed protein product [Rotaria socialis]CAF4736243.1 unnamed protein product [Rotaria socialis]
MLFIWYSWHQNSAVLSRSVGDCNGEHAFYKTVTLDSGWDNRAYAIYQRISQKLNKKKEVRLVKFPFGGLTARVLETDEESSFWDLVEKGTWELKTYTALMHYLSSDTVVVDVGTWIGPTVLFSSQLAARTYAIEADPAAFSKISHNLKQNAQSLWYHHVHLQAGCLGVESTHVQMKSALPGNSMSSIHKFFQQGNSRAPAQWTVRCYRLPELFTIWQINPTIEHVFVKIDIESYECKVLPNLYSWLATLKRKPTLYIAMHSQIATCSKEEYAMIAKIAELYRFRSTSFVTGNGSGAPTGEHVLSDLIAPP